MDEERIIKEQLMERSNKGTGTEWRDNIGKDTTELLDVAELQPATQNRDLKAQVEDDDDDDEK